MILNFTQTHMKQLLMTSINVSCSVLTWATSSSEANYGPTSCFASACWDDTRWCLIHSCWVSSTWCCTMACCLQIKWVSGKISLGSCIEKKKFKKKLIAFDLSPFTSQSWVISVFDRHLRCVYYWMSFEKLFNPLFILIIDVYARKISPETG